VRDRRNIGHVQGVFSHRRVGFNLNTRRELLPLLETVPLRYEDVMRVVHKVVLLKLPGWRREVVFISDFIAVFENTPHLHAGKRECHLVDLVS
jgi:hypothetical protein